MRGLYGSGLGPPDVALNRAIWERRRARLMSTNVGVDAIGVSSGVVQGESGIEAELAVLWDGSSVVIRPLAAGDEASIVSWFASRFSGLSPEKLYARSLVLLQWLDPRVDSRLGDDRLDHEAIMALAADGLLVGVARRLHAVEPGSAEVTVAVADGWHGRGLATLLLERVATRARSAGILQFTARCLTNELTLIRLLSRLGPTSAEQPAAGMLNLRIKLL